jgi:predicted ATP-grasp superfamily ATP-dependent carboligase
LAAVRGLAQEGLEVHCAEWLPFACALLSRSCSRRWHSPNPKTQPEAYLNFILTQVQKESYNCLLAMEEETLLLLCSVRAEVEKYTTFPFASEALIRKLRDKANLAALARAAELPYPKTRLLQSLETLKSSALEWGTPLVLKPRITSGARGMAYLYKETESESLYQSLAPAPEEFLVQEYIPGTSYGVACLLGKQQEFLASFVHQRLRSFPVRGGPSTLAVSVAYPELVEAAYQLLAAQQWYGVAMVEFKVNPQGKAYLIEINPRFWGSLALPLHCGINFPYLLYKLALGEAFEPQHLYPVGKKMRWFFPGDLLHFIYNPQRLKLLPDFLNFKDAPDGILAWNDPLPLAGKMLSTLYFIFNKDLQRSLKVR